MERVAFLHVEAGDDLIVSFAIQVDDLGGVRSLMLMRTPKHESLLPEWERGVSVSDEELEGEDDDVDRMILLERIEFRGDEVTLASDQREFRLDLRRVDEDEMEEAKKGLRLMNRDGRFRPIGV